MKNFLNENLFAIVLFLLLIILLLIALIALVLVKLLLTSKNENTPAPVVLPATETSIKKLSDEVVVEKFYCQNHSEIPSAGSCLICEDVFCEKCLIEHENMYFCKEHFKIFVNNKWKQITDVKTTPNTPDDGLFIYHFKRHIWKEKQVPSFVLTHYKINIEEDFIESFIQLNVVEEEADSLTEDIERFKAKH